MPNSPKNRVTLSKIAQASGVSLTTVSLVLSEKPGIPQETRIRILEVARTLGYRFKTPVTSLSSKAIKTIGLLNCSKAESEPHVSHFYAYIIAGIDAICQQMGLNLMYANLPVGNDYYPIHLPPLLDNHDVDGFLLTGMIVQEEIAKVLDQRACPVVLFESYSPARIYNAVLYDNIQGAFQATEYLIRKGHRHIGFIGGHQKDFPSFCDRRAGYQQALADHQIDQAYFADFAVISAQPNETMKAAVDLVTQNRQITGLVCVNDDIAIDVMNGLKNAGIGVPQNISVIGFDDIYMAESVVPALTTMRANKHYMGRLAVQMLLNQTYQENGGCVTSLFRLSLVERNSVSPVSQGENA